MSKDTPQEAPKASADSSRTESGGNTRRDATAAGDKTDGGPSRGRGPRRGRRRRPRGGSRQDRSETAPQKQGPGTGGAAPSPDAPSRREPQHSDSRPGPGPRQGPRTDQSADGETQGGAPEGTRRRRRRRRPRRTTGSAPSQGQDGSRSDRTARPAGTVEARPQRPTDSGTLAFPDEDDWGIDPSAGEASTLRRPRQADTPSDPTHAEDDAAPDEHQRRPCCLFSPPAISLDPDGEDAVPTDLPEEPGDRQATLRNVVMAYVGAGRTLVAFDCGPLDIHAGDGIVVESDRGLVVGTAATPSARQMVRKNLARVVRLAGPKDDEIAERNAARQREAHQLCRQRIAARGLPMKLIRAEYLHSGNKVLFYFSADNRVDFRDLVRDMARQLRAKIEMRQVGVRDESKVSGGLGPCGRELCCHSWINSFQPVSIRMAKEQGLVLNPHRVSGMCGRLKCCLAYEQDLYHEARRGLPKPGQQVQTPDGTAVVNELDIPRQLVRVVGGDGTFATYPADRITPLSGQTKRPQRRG